MSFVLAKQEDPIKWPVKVAVPKDGGTYHQQKFTGEFLMLDQDDIDLLSHDGDQAFVREVLVGWSGVTDEEKSEVPFSKEALEAMVKTPYIRKAVIAAYYEMTAGIGQKN